MVDHNIWVDASTSWGIGLLVSGKLVVAWRLVEGWKTVVWDIGWAKTITIELGALWIAVTGIFDVHMGSIVTTPVLSVPCCEGDHTLDIQSHFIPHQCYH
jgi:hypothetical protein